MEHCHSDLGRASLSRCHGKGNDLIKPEKYPHYLGYKKSDIVSQRKHRRNKGDHLNQCKTSFTETSQCEMSKFETSICDVKCWDVKLFGR